MKRISCAVLSCVAASVVAVHAETQTGAPARGAAGSGSSIAFTGCVQEAVADGSLGGTPLGTPATPANAGIVANAQPRIDGFLLTGARAAGPSAVGTSGNDAAQPTGAADGADPSRDQPETFALEGNPAELAAHKGHHVEITGTLAPPAPSGVNSPAGTRADPFPTGVQRLRVQTLKMIAERCQEQ